MLRATLVAVKTIGCIVGCIVEFYIDLVGNGADPMGAAFIIGLVHRMAPVIETFKKQGEVHVMVEIPVCVTVTTCGVRPRQ